MKFTPVTGVEKAFAWMSGYPHGSYNEWPLSNAVRDRLTEAGLFVHQDASGNVYARKPATPGYEDKAPVMLQAHLDMVCTKVPGCEHDFKNDPISLLVTEDGWLHADGTSLGADDIYGCAYMLDLLLRDDAKHPELECLFTVEEEVGLNGADRFDSSMIRARRMVSLDGGNENVTTVSTCGGRCIDLILPLVPATASGRTFRIAVGGLTGGHSAVMIHHGRGNAIKILCHILSAIENTGAALISFDGGEANNAIPRDAWAVVRVPEAAEADVKKSFDTLCARFVKLYRDTDPGISITMEETAPAAGKAWSLACANLIVALPDGLRCNEPLRPNVKALSNNLGTLRMENDRLRVQCMIRLANQEYGDLQTEHVLAVGNAFGAKSEITSDYPFMEYNPESPMRLQYLQLAREMLGLEPREEATHGGMEIGYFSRRIPGMDIVCFGPDMDGIHSPTERLNLASFNRVYGVLVRMLEELP